MLISVFCFIQQKSPLTTAATVESIFGSSYYGIGRGISGLAGGLFIDKLGAVHTFRIIAISAVVTGILYGVATEVIEKSLSIQDPSFILNICFMARFGNDGVQTVMSSCPNRFLPLHNRPASP